MYPAYAAIREEMSAAAYGKDYKEMEQRASVQDDINNCCVHIILIQALQPQECVPLLLSVYEVYTMSRSSTNIARQLLPEVNNVCACISPILPCLYNQTIEKMNEMIISCKALSREVCTIE